MKVNLNFHQIPTPLSAQSKSHSFFPSVEAQWLLQGWTHRRAEGRRDTTSVWQGAKCWLLLWLGAYEWISSELLSSSMMWAKPSLANIFQFP